MRDLGICAPVVPAGRTTVQLAAINHHHMQVKKEKHWYSLAHHLLWLWDGNSTEELVVAEDLLVSRGQISCRGPERDVKRCFTFQS